VRRLCLLVMTSVVVIACASPSGVSEPMTSGSAATSGTVEPAPLTAGTGTRGEQTENPFPTAESDDINQILDSLSLASPPAEGEGSYRSFGVERIEWYARCLEERGMAVEIDYVTLGVTYRIPEGQEDAYSRIKAECRQLQRERFGMVDNPSPDLLEAWYRAYVWTWSCLRDHGYELSYPPTIDSFVESGGSNWQPYFELVSSGAAPLGDARAELESDCPQDPDFLVWFLGL